MAFYEINIAKENLISIPHQRHHNWSWLAITDFLIKRLAMKAIIVAALLLASVSSYSFGINALPIRKEIKAQQKLTDVPQAVLESFNSMFPNAKSVRWSVLTGAYKDNTQYLAQFRLDGVKRTARFKPDGTYLGGT